MKILCVDDHPLFRNALKEVLLGLSEEEEKPAIYEASSCEEALELCKELVDLDLILLDLELPGMDGLSGLARLRACMPVAPIVMISATERRSNVMQAIEQGAKGFIPKSSPTEVILGALKLVLSGGVYLPMAVMDVPTTQHNTLQLKNGPGLTPKQMDVLQILATGKSNREIAGQLGMAENTVRVHVRAIISYLGVTNRSEAGHVARQNGILNQL